MNYWSNYPKFAVSLMKSFYGDAAQKENDWGFEWLPKWDQAYDVIKYFNMMDKGDVTGYMDTMSPEMRGINPDNPLDIFLVYVDLISHLTGDPDGLSITRHVWLMWLGLGEPV